MSSPDVYLPGQPRTVLGNSSRKPARTFKSRRQSGDNRPNDDENMPENMNCNSSTSVMSNTIEGQKIDFRRKQREAAVDTRAEVNEERRSVSELKNWLVNFEESQKSHVNKLSTPSKAQNKPQDVANTPEPLRSSGSGGFIRTGNRNVPISNASSKQPLLQDNTSSSLPKPMTPVSKPPLSRQIKSASVPPKCTAGPKTIFTPVNCDNKQPGVFLSMKKSQRISAEEVQATDAGYAPVSKLSSWLANDAFNNKKEKIVRKDPNVYRKSLKFGEDEMTVKESDKIVACEIATAEQNVSARASWLKNQAFGINGGEDCHQKEEPSMVHGSGKVERTRMHAEAFEKDSEAAASVKSRRLELIKREEAVKRKAEMSNKVSYKVKWEGSGGQYSKKITSEVGPAPKKTFADLP